ncbi:MAG TPA: DNA alkylation repair protein [Roseiflexaceae bacterium]|nr:DNA alkylation repair protein [Roseiflexaceae bacterium]
MGSAQLVETRKRRTATPQHLLAQIQAYCAAHAEAQIVAKYARYFKEGYDAYGVPERELSTQRAAWLEAYRAELGLEGFLDLGDLLWQTGKYELGFLAISFVDGFKHEFRPATLERLGRWFALGVGNWAHTDVLCETLAEFLTRAIVPLEAFGPWRQAPYKYQRRAVPVTLLPLLKIRQEYTQLLDFLRPLMLDKEQVVQQGLGWFLREAWKRQPEPVEVFLLEWKDTAPRLIFQYATEKIPPENKARFRKAK